MVELVKGNSIYHLVAQADAISKCVLFALFFLSVLTWAVFIGKVIALRLKRRHLNSLLHAISHTVSLDQLIVLEQRAKNTMPGYFLSCYIASINTGLKTKNYLSNIDFEYVERELERSIDTVLSHEESYLPVLSTSAAVAPLLGLLGTTWGLVHSFMRISEKQMADIVTVAPGIAEALITTFAGLVVAIPALIMYNYLVVQVRKTEHQILQLADMLRMLAQPLLRL